MAPTSFDKRAFYPTDRVTVTAADGESFTGTVQAANEQTAIVRRDGDDAIVRASVGFLTHLDEGN